MRKKKDSYAYGTPAEVEGGEVTAMPGMEGVEISGPSHEAGGVDTTLAPGELVFSDRLSVDGKTMAERKQARDRQETKLMKALKAHPTDSLTRKTAKRVSESNKKQEMHDLAIQDMANRTLPQPTQEGNKPKMAYGSGVNWNSIYSQINGAKGVNGFNNEFAVSPDYMDTYNQQNVMPGAMPSSNSSPAMSDSGMIGPPQDPNAIAAGSAKSTVPNTAKSSGTGTSMTAGSLVGMAGTALNGAVQIGLTLANRRGDTPRVNQYNMYGEEAATYLDEAERKVNYSKQNQLREASIGASTQRAANRGSVRSLNTLRALNSATDMAHDNAVQNIYASAIPAEIGINQQQAALSERSDNAKAQGATMADEGNRADRDAFYTNLSQNLATTSQDMQAMGKNINTNKYNKDVLALLPELSKYGLGIEYDANGNPALKQVKK